jgi:DNA polymerase III delta subunit
MLTLLHGDNPVASRQVLHEFIETSKTRGFKDIISINGKKTSLEAIIEACEAGSLFGSDRLIVIETLHSHPSKKNLSEIVNYLSSVHCPLSTIILWESKSLTAIQLKKLSNFTPYIFKTSKNTFKFLESLVPNRESQFLPLFHQACTEDTPEFIFLMLARQLRLLLECSESNFKFPPWQIGKLKAQARQYRLTQLLKLHDQIYDLDRRVKTGQTVLNLQGELDLILSTI